MANEMPETLEDEARPVVAQLAQNLQSVMGQYECDDPERAAEWEHVLESLRDPETLHVEVTQIVTDDTERSENQPTLKLVVTDSQDEEAEPLILVIPEEVKGDIFGQLSVADYRTLCEYGAELGLVYWVSLMQEAKAQGMMSDQFAIAVMQAKSNIDYIKGFDSDIDLREVIKPF